MTDPKELIERLREHAYTLDMRPEDCDEWKAADALAALSMEVERYRAMIAAAPLALPSGGKVVGNDKPAFDAWWEHD